MSAERQAFQALFDDAFADVWGFARRRCASSADADDVAAETFAVAWRRRADVPAAEARLWLFGIARHVLANLQRSATRRARLHLRLAEDIAPGPGREEGAGYDGALLTALATLSLDDREILIMHAWDELSVTEISHLLDCSPNAVSLRLHKARRRLATEMQKDVAVPGHVVTGPRLLEGEMP